jgi:hypothetical protein
LPAGQALRLGPVPPHGARLLALRRRTAQPTLVASSLHFSQGSEVTTWQVDGSTLTLGLALGRRAAGHLCLALPAAPRAAESGGQRPSVLELGPGLYRLSLEVNGSSLIRVEW